MSIPKVLFDWLVSAVEKHPIVFTVIAGVTSYLLALLWLLIFIRMDVIASQFALVGASLIIVVFHWFMARYERKSKIAQFVSLAPAVALVFLVLLVFGEFGRTTEICVRDTDNGQLVDCRVKHD